MTGAAPQVLPPKFLYLDRHRSGTKYSRVLKKQDCLQEETQPLSSWRLRTWGFNCSKIDLDFFFLFYVASGELSTDDI